MKNQEKDFKNIIIKINNLAKIEIDENELPQFASEIQKIIDYFNQLQKLDLSQTPNIYYVLETSCPRREDKKEIKESDFVKNLPNFSDRFFKIKKIL